MSWRETQQEEWSDDEFAEATTWVLETLALGGEDEGHVMGLLETYGPEDITPEMIEEMRRIQ